MRIMWSVKSSLIVFSAALILQTVAINAGMAQSANPSPLGLSSSPKEAAERALKVLQSLKSKDEAHFVELGFKSAEEAKDLGLGQSFPVFRVGLNQLNDFQPGDPNDRKSVPPTLVVDANRVIFLVIVKGSEVRSSITVTKYKGKGWKATRRGSPKFAHLLDKLRKSNPSFDTLISIPALNLYLLADAKKIQAGQFEVIPLADISIPTLKLTLEAGKLLSAQDVFAKLAMEAKELLDGKGVSGRELDEDFR